MLENGRDAEGATCWAELETRDLEGSKRFYNALFGWTLEDSRAAAEGSASALARLDGRETASLQQIENGSGAQTRWRVDFFVPDAEAAARAACNRGGRKLGNTPVTHGAALLRDATGAALGVREPAADAADAPGSLAWSELVTRRPDAAKRFYAEWLGWEARNMGPGSYSLFLKGGKPVAGLVPMDEERGRAESHWRLYFRVSDCRVSVEKAKSLGAHCLLPATRLPGVGTVALLTDPQGGPFALLQSAPSARQ